MLIAETHLMGIAHTNNKGQKKKKSRVSWLQKKNHKEFKSVEINSSEKSTETPEHFILKKQAGNKHQKKNDNHGTAHRVVNGRNPGNTQMGSGQNP